MRTPDYVLSEAFEWRVDAHDKRVLPAGSFVRPIDEYYLPSGYRREWESERTVACYTRYGIVRIPEKIVRRV